MKTQCLLHFNLHRELLAKIENGAPVMPPGVPRNYHDATQLVTEDCIQPAGAPKRVEQGTVAA